MKFIVKYQVRDLGFEKWFNVGPFDTSSEAEEQKQYLLSFGNVVNVRVRNV